MKFSILISSYNKGKYIKKCLDSCLAQKEKNYEIILYDNNSTDKTSKILDQYKSKIKFFKKKRITNSPALNQIDLILHAFKKSKGSIVCLLDGDDFLDKNKLSILKKNFNNNPKINTIFDLPIEQYRSYKKKFKIKNKLQKNIWPTIIPTSGISCRKKFFKKFSKKTFLKNFKHLEIDFRLNVYSRILDNKYLILNNDLTTYRKVNNGIMSDINKFSKKWWIKRFEAHKFMKDLFFKSGLKYNNKFDFLISKLLSK